MGEIIGDQIDLGGTPVVEGRLTLPPIVTGPCAPHYEVPQALIDPRINLTLDEGIVGVKLVGTSAETGVKLEGSSRGAVGPIWGPKRSFLDYIYKHCNDSCPEKRKYDDYGLPVPKMEEAHDGIEYSFVSEDVWRCYAPGFLSCWEE